MRTLRIAGILLGIMFVLSGCITPSNDAVNPARDIRFAVTHIEESEKTIVTIGDVSGKATWGDVKILWNGKAYGFGSIASFTDRWFQVDGRKDASAPIENGDRITVSAAGLGTIQFVAADGGRVIATYDAMIPDNHKPAAPVPVGPADEATGVALTPAWQWTQVADPSGVSYILQWSLDPLFATPLTVSKARLTASMTDTEPGEKLQGGQKYYWRVAATDGAGNLGAWSEVWSFTTAGGQLVL